MVYFPDVWRLTYPFHAIDYGVPIYRNKSSTNIFHVDLLFCFYFNDYQQLYKWKILKLFAEGS